MPAETAAYGGEKMSDESRDVTREYRLAERAVEAYNPGEQPDIGKLMRAAYIHGYANALMDFPPWDHYPDSAGEST